MARTLQCFLQDTYGQVAWQEIACAAGLEVPDFEAMLDYDVTVVAQVLDAAVMRLDKPRDVILEDIGTYLVTHPNNEGLRRLLRYGGVDFIDFLHSLEDLPGRARLAVADLELPELELRDFSGSQFFLICRCRRSAMPGFGHVLVGVLRAMADDYGALVILDHRGRRDGTESVDVAVVEAEFTEGRDFELGPAPARQGGLAS